MSEIRVDRLINTFCELVKIPSESPDDQKFIAHAESLFKMMGGKTKKDAYGNLVAKFPAKNSKSTTPIAFACHADTVKPGIGIEPVVEDGKVRSKGNTILAGDDKMGIAEIMEMLRAAEKHPPIEVILTRCEEIGSLGASNMDFSMVDSKTAYVIDMDDCNDVVVGGPTYITFDVTYKGKPSHAGMAPEKGISSILAASKAVSRLRLGKLDEETTANVGVFQGGEIRNGVPENTKLLAECRCLTHDKALALADEMEKIFNEASKEVGTQVTIERKVALRAYLLDEKSEVVQNVVKGLAKYDVKANIRVVRGGTDATFFNAHGIATAVLGVGIRDAHSCQEHAIVSEVVTMTNVMKDIVESLA